MADICAISWCRLSQPDTSCEIVCYRQLRSVLFLADVEKLWYGLMAVILLLQIDDPWWLVNSPGLCFQHLHVCASYWCFFCCCCTFMQYDAARVRWPTGSANNYRVGYDGKVSVTVPFLFCISHCTWCGHWLLFWDWLSACTLTRKQVFACCYVQSCTIPFYKNNSQRIELSVFFLLLASTLWEMREGWAPYYDTMSSMVYVALMQNTCVLKYSIRKN